MDENIIPTDIVYGDGVLSNEHYLELIESMAQKLIDQFKGHTIKFTKDCLRQAIRQVDKQTKV